MNKFAVWSLKEYGIKSAPTF